MREKTYAVSSIDLNRKSFLKISSELAIMQDIAYEDLLSFGIDTNELRKSGPVFVLTKLRIKTIFSPKAKDEIELITAPQKTAGISFYRNFKAICKGKLCFEAATQWVLIDYNSRKLLRPNVIDKEIKPYLMENDLLLEKIKMPEAEPILTEKRKIYRSMLDENDHLNNTFYADMIFDIIPEEKEEIDLSIEFLHEAFLNEIIEIKLYKIQNAYLISALKEDSTEVFRARVI